MRITARERNSVVTPWFALSLKNLTIKRKDTCHVNYNRCYSNHIVAPGVNLFLHHGRFHSRSSGDRHCGHLGESHSRTEFGRDKKLISK